MARPAIDVEERFWSKVSIPPDVIAGCWLWLGAASASGKRQFNIVKKKGQKRLVREPHCVAYELIHGPPSEPTRFELYPQCQEPACVNPAHYKAGPIHLGGFVHGHTVAQGEKNWSAKLTEKDIQDIRESPQSNKALAAFYGVADSGISRIRNYRIWKHVP